MNGIPAQEIERCGISAVDEVLRLGPVHVVKNNRPQPGVWQRDVNGARPGADACHYHPTYLSD